MPALGVGGAAEEFAVIETVSGAVMPLVLLLAAIPLISRRKDYFSHFLAGAREGMETAVRLLPTMIALVTALSMLRASGAVDIVTAALTDAAAAVGIPAEILPLVVTRPVSGSASTAAFADLLAAVGADSFPAFAASVLMGSSDTMIYIITVYFSGTAVGGRPPIRRTRHAFPAAAAAMLLCVFLSAAVSRLFFGGSA